MFISRKKRELQIPKRRLEDQADPFETLISSGIILNGTLSGRKAVGIAGHFEGDVKIEGLVWVLPGGRIKGMVNSTGVIIEGEIEGEVVATDRIEIRSTGRMKGDMACGRIAVAEGAFFEGEVKMLDNERQLTSFEEKRKR